MIKMFEADQKRLKGILVTHQEKVPDLAPHEFDQRNEIINKLKESQSFLKEEIDQQTKDFQMGFITTQPKAVTASMMDETVDPSVHQHTSGRIMTAMDH